MLVLGLEMTDHACSPAPIAERQRRPEHVLWREFELAPTAFRLERLRRQCC